MKVYLCGAINGCTDAEAIDSLRTREVFERLFRLLPQTQAEVVASEAPRPSRQQPQRQPRSQRSKKKKKR